MPTLSTFDGIKIITYYRDYLPPHFHAIYAEYEAEVGVDPIVIQEGNLPRPERNKV